MNCYYSSYSKRFNKSINFLRTEMMTFMFESVPVVDFLQRWSLSTPSLPMYFMPLLHQEVDHHPLGLACEQAVSTSFPWDLGSVGEVQDTLGGRERIPGKALKGQRYSLLLFWVLNCLSNHPKEFEILFRHRFNKNSFLLLRVRSKTH